MINDCVHVHGENLGGEGELRKRGEKLLKIITIITMVMIITIITIITMVTRIWNPRKGRQMKIVFKRGRSR